MRKISFYIISFKKNREKKMKRRHHRRERKRAEDGVGGRKNIIK